MRQPLGEYDDRDDDFGLLGEERSEADYAPPDRQFVKVLLVGLAMAVFAGGLWFAYHEGTRHPDVAVGPGGVPLIRADKTPDKVKPENPGGMKIPDQNASIYNEKQTLAPVEKLLPPPEKPLPRPMPVEKLPPAPSLAAPPAPAAPARVAHPAPPAPARQATAAARPARPAPPAAGHPVRVRLASMRTPEEARAEWARLKRNNPDLLGNLTAVGVRTDLGARGIFYRIEAGPLADRAAAEHLCHELKQRKLGCLIAR